MRNANSRLSIKPVSALRYALPTGITGVNLPLTGGGTAAINIYGITRGYPTIVTLGNTPSFRGGQIIKLASVGGMTEINGYHKVIQLMPSNRVMLDVDSSAFTVFTSGGTVSHNVLYDTTATLAPQDILGTTTDIWSNPIGLMPHASGTYTAAVTSDIDVFDLTGFDGILYVGGMMQIEAGTPTAFEYLISVNRALNTGGNNAAGHAGVGFHGTTAIQMSFNFRPRAAVSGTQTLVGTTALTAGVNHHCGWLVDCRTPSAPMITAHLDGHQRAASLADMTVSQGLPNASLGMSFGASLNDALAPEYILGAGGRQAKARNWAWLKLDAAHYGLDDAYEILRAHFKAKELVL